MVTFRIKNILLAIVSHRLTDFIAAAISSYLSACSASLAFCTNCSRSTMVNVLDWFARYSRSSVSKSMAIFSVNRNAVRFFSANRKLQLFPAVCALFPPPHFLSAASSFRKGGCLGNDVTSHTWNLWAPMGPLLIGITVPRWGFVGNGVPFRR